MLAALDLGKSITLKLIARKRACLLWPAWAVFDRAITPTGHHSIDGIRR